MDLGTAWKSSPRGCFIALAKRMAKAKKMFNGFSGAIFTFKLSLTFPLESYGTFTNCYSHDQPVVKCHSHLR